MKTIHVSDALWKRLRVEAATRGVPMRQVVEEMGEMWLPSATLSEQVIKVTALRGAAEALRANTPKELTVELED